MWCFCDIWTQTTTFTNKPVLIIIFLEQKLIINLLVFSRRPRCHNSTMTPRTEHYSQFFFLLLGFLNGSCASFKLQCCHLLFVFSTKTGNCSKKSETDVVWVDRNNCWGWLYIDPFSGNLWSHRRINWFHFLFLHAVPYSQDFNHIFPEWPNPRDKCQDMTSRCVQPSGHVSSFGLFNFLWLR